jgi:hypothetical protein
MKTGYALALLALASGCDLNALIPQDARTLVIPADSEVTVPGSTIVGQNPLLPSEVFPADFGAILSQEIQQTFSTESVQKEAVESLKLTSMTVTVKNPTQNGTTVRHLGFLESATFFLGAGAIEPRRVAYSADGAFDDMPTYYEFELTDEELVDLLNEGEAMDMTADVVPERRPNFETTLLFEVELTVIVDAQGALGGGA